MTTYGDMTVRQFLNGVREAKAEVRNLQRKLLELKTASENVTAHWKDVPGGGGSADSHKDEIVNALCDLNTAYGEKVLAYLRYIEETEAFIDTVSGFENRLILQLRYVDCMKWDTIEATMRRMGIYYSTRHITRLHGYALLAAERAWAVWKETERHEDRNSQQEDQ